jgi:AcrR family transcriptional regulator
VKDDKHSVDRGVLFEAVCSAPLTQIAPDFGMTANGLAKMCDRLGVPRPSRNHWRLPSDARHKARPDPSLTAENSKPSNKQPQPKRMRMPIEERRAQLLDIAARIVTNEGTEAVTLNRLAREASISEAQAHNCFPRRIDVLAALARREVRTFEESRRGVVVRGQDRMTRIVLSTANYLAMADRRGGLIQSLLLEREVREILRGEHEIARNLTTEPIIQSLAEEAGMTREVAVASNWLITALCLRTGGLVSNGSLPLESAMRLCLPMVMGCVHSNAAQRHGNPA